jgi:hypothetical protein
LNIEIASKVGACGTAGRALIMVNETFHRAVGCSQHGAGSMFQSRGEFKPFEYALLKSFRATTHKFYRERTRQIWVGGLCGRSRFD